ncbi:26S proteasome non-ATPase regulatory subunit 4-like [Hydractinia symbiolongicarpus]|uniref:26S proteasome non-ATPase regulatory subunit 4-like n=1 Tax=Hydractinia symbiolongicarpus TaxID=13093 RepID=UPI00254C279C|nr:26S proteasome non-ATPase regulatory subunit 4-like [Hydractinia symbiolongicarpus]
MVLESTVVCVDNSEWTRNGDFLPTRIQAQQDAVSIICHAKTRQNPENNVALMTSAGLEVLVTLTTDVGRILSKLHHIQPSGEAKFSTGIRIAHLALKHRQGKNHRMRIVTFVGSPIDASDKDLVKLAKKLKKEKVNVDVVALGEDTSTSEKLTQFIETLNGKEGTGSHLVVVPPGNLTDALRTSAIVQGEGGYTPASDFGGGFDVDPNLDPELALALRVSMEEQRQRQEEETKKESIDTAMETGTEDAVPAATNEDNLLMNALQSLGGGGSSGVDYNAMTEDEQIALAIQMSMSESTDQSAETKTETPTAMESEPATTSAQPMEEDQDYSAVMNDPAFLQHLVGNLPGVDPNSEAVQNALQELTSGQDGSESSEKEKKEEEKK